MTFPLHPIAQAEAIASATPNPCEGSVGHLRDEAAWQLADDMRRVLDGDTSLLTEYVDDIADLGTVRGCLVRDAIRACTRWTLDRTAA